MTAVEMARRKKRDIPSRNQKVDSCHRPSVADDSKGSFPSYSEHHFLSGGPTSSIGEKNKSESNPLGYRPSFSKAMSTDLNATSLYPSQFSAVGVCPFPVSTDDILRVEELISLNSEIWKTTKSEITSLERKRKFNQDKLLGLKFSTQDRNVVFAEQANDLEEKKQELNAMRNSRLLITIQLDKLQKEVDVAENPIDQAAPLKALHEMQDELEVVDSDLETMTRKVDIASSLCDNLRKIAYQGEQVFSNTQSEGQDLEDAILRATLQVSKFSVQHEALSNQLAEMRLGGGMSLWPKPILHPPIPELVLDSSRHVIHLTPCGCCKRWYNCNDVLWTSCKHCYHPACLIEHLKTSTKCLVCNERLHPDWWSSWGIRELDNDLKQLAIDLNLEAERKNSIQMLRNSMKSTSSGVPNEISSEQTELHTELGSTSALKSVRGRHSLGAADSKDFVSPSTQYMNHKDEFFSYISPSQSRHNALPHSPTTNFPQGERDNCEVDSPYKSPKMQKGILLEFLESNIDDGDEELGVCKFRQPFHPTSKTPSITDDGFKKVSWENTKSDSLDVSFKDKIAKKTVEIQAVMTNCPRNIPQESQHLGHNYGDHDCQAQLLEISTPLENKRRNSAIATESSIKKLKVSIGNGPDDVDEPRKVTALEDLTDVKGKKKNIKWAPTTKKPARSWGVSAQMPGMIRSLRSRDHKSSE